MIHTTYSLMIVLLPIVLFASFYVHPAKGEVFDHWSVTAIYLASSGIIILTTCAAISHARTLKADRKNETPAI